MSRYSVSKIYSKATKATLSSNVLRNEHVIRINYVTLYGFGNDKVRLTHRNRWLDLCPLLMTFNIKLNIYYMFFLIYWVFRFSRLDTQTYYGTKIEYICFSNKPMFQALYRSHIIYIYGFDRCWWYKPAALSVCQLFT